LIGKAHERIGKIFNKNARGKNQVVIAGKKVSGGKKELALGF